MAKYYRYTVEGRGAFPLDMLRYDACWPERTEDAMSIAEPTYFATREKVIELNDKSRQVRLVSNTAPTDARWRSFMWKVVSNDS